MHTLIKKVIIRTCLHKSFDFASFSNCSVFIYCSAVFCHGVVKKINKIEEEVYENVNIPQLLLER